MFNLKELYVYTVKNGKLKLFYNKGNKPISSKKRQKLINNFYANENELNMEREKYLKRNADKINLYKQLVHEENMFICKFILVIVALIVVIKLLLKLIF